MAMLTTNTHEIPRTLIGVLFRHPEFLQLALSETGLAPRDLALWARQSGEANEIEKLAGWLSVSRQPESYQPLLEAAYSHLRAGDLVEALPVFRWAYRIWSAATDGRHDASHRYHGVKLLALWGECLYRLGQKAQAQERWLWALAVIPDAETLNRLARVVERCGALPEYEAVLAEAERRGLPGAQALWQRRRRIAVAVRDGMPGGGAPGTPVVNAAPDAPGVAVMADVSNLDMVCGDQYGYNWSLDYGRLLRAAGQHGPARVKIAFVPDLPETLPVRYQLEQAGFQLELQRPKHSHGRIVANADAAMASFAVRWAGDDATGRVELWTGDGDFMHVRRAIHQAWPHVVVAFRSFEVGTAAGIRQLGDAWQPIGPEYLRPRAANAPGF